MVLEKINIGAAPNDKTGDPLRDAFSKVNSAIDQVNANTHALGDMQEVLGEKVDAEPGKGLSANDFTDTEKQKLAGLEGSHYRGLFVSLADLVAAIPAAAAGDYADVDGGEGEDVERYIWDASDSKWVLQSGSAEPLTAAQVKALYESNDDTNPLTDADVQAIKSISGKVDKELGKGLSANDFTDTEKQKLSVAIGDAPIDDKQYARKNGSWAEVAGSGNAVQQTSGTGVALLPEGNNAQRPPEGSIPAGFLAVRGNTQDPADYWAEFWDRSVSKWKAFADRVWTGLQIDAAVQSVKDWVNQQIGFAIIYPNGGSAASPAFVSINSRYVTPNPFPGFNVICVAEVLYNGVWGEAGWMYSNGEGGRGVKASQSSSEGIVTQTGRTHLLSGAMDSGGTHVVGSPWNAALQCRVKVTKVKGAV